MYKLILIFTFCTNTLLAQINNDSLLYYINQVRTNPVKFLNTYVKPKYKDELSLNISKNYNQDLKTKYKSLRNTLYLHSIFKLNKLSFDSTLNKYAKENVDVCVKKDKLAHHSTPMDKLGLDVVENGGIVSNYDNVNIRLILDYLFDMYVNSNGHRNNLLIKDGIRIGIYSELNKNGDSYYNTIVISK
jgi:uncharacterized protein YkwD